jgi:hypothetical protein
VPNSIIVSLRQKQVEEPSLFLSFSAAAIQTETRRSKATGRIDD